jgi:hypothetical protein
MSEVSRHDVNASVQEYKKTAKVALNSLQYILKRIEESNRSIDNQVGIYIDKGNNHISRKLVDKNNIATALNSDELQQLQIALTKPQELRGEVLIFVGKEKVMHVENGVVNTDKLNLIKLQQEFTAEAKQPLKEQVKVEVSKENKLVEDIREMIKVMRKQRGIPEGDYMPIPSNKYYFWEKDGEVAVTCKYGRGELLNNKGLTALASQTDIKNFEKIHDFTVSVKQEQCRIEQQQAVEQIVTNAPKIGL